MRATKQENNKNTPNCKNIRLEFSTALLRSIVFDEVQIWSQDRILVSNPSPKRWTEYVVDCIFVKTVSKHLARPLLGTSLTSGRAVPLL